MVCGAPVFQMRCVENTLRYILGCIGGASWIPAILAVTWTSRRVNAVRLFCTLIWIGGLEHRAIHLTLLRIQRVDHELDLRLPPRHSSFSEPHRLWVKTQLDSVVPTRATNRVALEDFGQAQQMAAWGGCCQFHSFFLLLDRIDALAAPMRHKLFALSSDRPCFKTHRHDAAAQLRTASMTQEPNMVRASTWIVLSNKRVWGY